MREVTNLNIKKIIKSERGDVSYISTFVYILVAMIMVAFILNVFHIISVKQEMDHISDQLVKQIRWHKCRYWCPVFLSGCTTIRSRRSHLSGNQFREYQQDSDRNAFLCDGNRSVLSGWILENEPDPD